MKWLTLILVTLLLGVSCQQTDSVSTFSNQTPDCSYLKPDNPYSYGSGHYAGFEWAESNGVAYCGGNSDSFIEGCEEYLYQEQLYNECF